MQFLSTMSRNEKILFAIGVALVLSRFIAIGIVPFLIDEPLFQVWSQEMIHQGKFRLVAMGGSSLPISYGAGAIWLYCIPNWISSNPLAFVLFHTSLYCTGFFALFLSIKKTLGTKIALYAFLLATSSPFLFFFSRHTWDTTFFMPISAAAIYLVSLLSEEQRTSFFAKKGFLLPFIGLALLLALAINIQLACGPFVLSVGFSLLFLWWKEKNKSKNFFFGIIFLVATVILLITPYVLAAWEAHNTSTLLSQRKQNPHWGTLRHLWWNILYSMAWISTWQARKFYEPIWFNFTQFSGPVFAQLFHLDLAGWVTKLLSLFGIFSPIGFAIKRKAVPTLGWICFIGAAVMLLVFQFINIPMQVHYFQSFWWLPFVGFSVAIFSLGIVDSTFTKVLVGVGVLTNAIFLCLTLLFLIENGGIRGMYHGTGIVEIEQSVTLLCEQAKQREKRSFQLDISQVLTPDNPIQYFLDRNLACKDLQVAIVKEPLASSIVRFLYEPGRQSSAKLIVDWKN